MNEKQRTTQQNKSLHLLFSMIAQELTDAGYDMRKTLKPGIEIPSSAHTVKEYLFRPIMKAQLGKKSTTELNTKDIDLVFNTLARHLSEKLGIVIDFPSKDV